MKVNVKKLDETIAKLQELRRLATDPTLAPFVTVTGRSTANGSAPRGASLAEAAGASANGHGTLKATVLEACLFFTAPYAIKDVYDQMKRQGYTPSSESAEKSVGNMLRALASEGVIKVAVQGKGRRATTYSNI